MLFTACLPFALVGRAAAQEGGAAEVALRYARVTVDEAPLYCWPSAVAQPPHYEDTLTKGQVVQVGRTEGTFIHVVLPLGPVGYVSKRYAESDEGGKVTTRGSKVSFRYRTVTTEAPVMQLDDGTELFVVGELDDWWRARLPAAEAWLPVAQVQIGDPADANLAEEFAKTRSSYEGEVSARLEAIAAEKRRIEQEKADAEAVQLVQEAFEKEMKKPKADQDYEPLSSALDKVEATLGEGSSARALVASLRKRIQTQQWIVEATLVRDTPPVPSKEPLPEEQPKDELDRFPAIGWLRYESRIGGMGTYYLEKGGQRLYHLTCTSGRYDLSMFVDCEVGVMGPRRRPSSDAFSIFDIERIEVLGHNRK